MHAERRNMCLYLRMPIVASIMFRSCQMRRQQLNRLRFWLRRQASSLGEFSSTCLTALGSHAPRAGEGEALMLSKIWARHAVTRLAQVVLRRGLWRL